jgi:molybdate transport system substrate-binding protein
MRMLKKGCAVGGLLVLLVGMGLGAAGCDSGAPTTPLSATVLPASIVSPTSAPSAPVPPTAPPLPAGTGGLTIFAATSLKETFTEASRDARVAIAAMPEVQFNFQGSQQLVTQLQQGAPADVFASADKPTMDKAVQAGLIEGVPRELARNVLVVVLPGDNPGHIQTLSDLARAGLKLSLADPSVPVGNYSEQALDKLAADPTYGADFKQKVLANVVSREDNVRQVVTRVQLDQVDAGIVYTTDAQATNAQPAGAVGPVKTLAIPDQYNVIAVYYIGVVKSAPHAAAAQEWISYMLSDAGQAVLAKYGFLPPGP